MPSTSVRPGDGALGIEIEQAAEMRIFAAGAAEIVPGGERDGLHLGVRFFRIGGPDIGERRPMRLEERTEGAGDRGAQGTGALGAERPREGEDAAHDADHDRSDETREKVAGTVGLLHVGEILA